MATAEEKFRNLLSRAGANVSRATISNAFRQDAALAEVLPWIVENVTDACVVDPQLQRDYKYFEGRLSLPLNQTPGEDIREEQHSFWNVEDALELNQIEEELQSHLAQRDQEIALLTGLTENLAEQSRTTEEKLKYAYEEDDVFVTALVRESERRGMQSCEQLETQCSAFASTLKEFKALLKEHGSELYFTQSKPEQYWERSEEHTRQLERMGVEMLGTSMPTRKGGDSKLRQLLRMSALEQRPWFQELERLRQYKQVSDLRRMEMMLTKNRTEVRCKVIQQSASDFSRNADALAGLIGRELTVEEVKTENKKLVLKKKTLMNKKLHPLLSQVNRSIGLDLIREYIPRVCAEWNNILIQKHEFLQHVSRQLDRHRVFSILGEIERQKLDDVIQYTASLGQTFHSTTEIVKNRSGRYVSETCQSVDFIRPDDVYLHQLSSFVKLCSEKLEESEVLTQIESSNASDVTAHKRLHSTAFSETPRDRSASGLSPVSKLIKEQKQQQSTKSRHPPATPKGEITPAELETSLRRLSVEGDPSGTALFIDTPTQKTAVTAVPLHEFTLQANRLMALPAASHLSIARLFPDALLRHVMWSAEALNEVHGRMFHSSDGQHLVVSVPTMKSALDAIERLIHEMNQIGCKIKGESKSILGYLERHPEEAKARQYLEQFFRETYS